MQFPVLEINAHGGAHQLPREANRLGRRWGTFREATTRPVATLQGREALQREEKRIPHPREDPQRGGHAGQHSGRIASAGGRRVVFPALAVPAGVWRFPRSTCRETLPEVAVLTRERLVGVSAQRANWPTHFLIKRGGWGGASGTSAVPTAACEAFPQDQPTGTRWQARPRAVIETAP